MAKVAPKTITAIISGHMEITPAQFSEHYQHAILEAVRANHHFVIGDAPGTDDLALSFLLSQDSHSDVKDRVTIYPSRPYNVRKYKAMGLKCIPPETWNPNKMRKDPRARHLARDKMMSEASDYDILWVRTENESKQLFGEKWRPRVSATELNRQRRAEIAKILQLNGTSSGTSSNDTHLPSPSNGAPSRHLPVPEHAASSSCSSE